MSRATALGRFIAMVSKRLFLALVLVSIVPAANAFNLAQDFSVTNGNPNGVWSYGHKSGGDTSGALVLFSQIVNDPLAPWYGYDISLGCPSIWRNLRGGPSYGVPHGWTSLHPGPGNELATARFTAPSSGPCSIVGTFLDGDGGDVDVYVAHNGTLLLAITNIPGAQAFSFNRTIAAGDTIDFMVGNAGSFYYDNTPIDVEIGIVPEPASLLALVGGLAAVARRRR